MPILKKVVHYTFKTIKILLITFAVLCLILFCYVSYNKKKIIAQVTADIEKKMNGKISYSAVDLTFFKSFPKISVLVKDISVTDTMFETHKHSFFSAKETFVSLNVFSLISGKPALGGIKINDGNIYLFTDTSGYTNTYLLRPKNKSSADIPKQVSRNVSLKDIQLHNVDIIIDDQRKNKYHDLLAKNVSVALQDNGVTLSMNTDAAILVNSLAFNKKKGSYLRNATFSGDFVMQYEKQTQKLSFNDIDVKLSGQGFNLSGAFDLGKNDPQFSLQLHTKEIGYKKLRSLLTAKIDSSLSIVDLDGPLNADAILKGPLQGGEPAINVSFNAKQTQLTTPFLDFDTATFQGTFTNEAVAGLDRNDSNSLVTIDHFMAGWHGLPLLVKRIEIANLSTPILNCDMHSSFPLTLLNEVITTNSLQLNSGQGSFDLTYKGPLIRNDNTNSFLNGAVSFAGAEVVYAPRNIALKNLSAAMIFKNSDLYIQNMHCNVLGNLVTMNGVGKNLLTLINSAPNKVAVDWNIYSPQLDIASFIYLLQNRVKTVSTKKSNKYFGQMATKIDDLLDESSINLTLKADKVFYNKFHAENLNASISLLQDRYVLNSVNMNHAGGQMGLNGIVLNQQKNYHPATLNVKMNNVDVKRLFNAFDNFGQDAITAQNLQGSLTTTVAASMAINDGGKIIPASLKSTVDFSLKNGGLNDYDPVKKLQQFIFKKRDFDNISFAELKDRFVIANEKININRMEIQSSVLSMFVEGVYSQKGDGTDISIQVPLSNLKKRKEDYNPENIGTDKKAGNSIFIRGRPGSDGKVKFKLDLFNKFKKDKNKAS